MATRRRSPQDLTGARTDQLNENYAEEIKSKSASMTMLNKAKDGEPTEVVDYVDPDDIETMLAGEVGEDGVTVTVGETTVKTAVKTMRVNEDLPFVVIGAGTEYSFETGKEYRVPAHVYDHLNELGYVWH